jgi:hypothetical protein
LHRKNREVNEVFASGLSWPAAIDAAADVYNGVFDFKKLVEASS